MPEVAKGSLTRLLIHAARRLEELGELSADFSGQAERCIFYAWNRKPKQSRYSFKLVMSSAVARWSSSLAKTGPMSAFKLIGAGCFSLSSLTSVAALILNRGGLRQRQANRIINIYNPKTKLAKPLRTHIADPIKRWANHLQAQSKRLKNSRQGAQDKQSTRISLSTLIDSKSHSGTVAQALARFSYGTFKILNKLGASWDKHLAYWLTTQMTKQTGWLLGARLSFTITTGAAAALGLALSPLNVSFSTLGLTGCALAAVAAYMAYILVNLPNRPIQQGTTG